MKKIFSIVLAMSLLFTIFGVIAMAADVTYTLSTDKEEYSAGDTFDLSIVASAAVAGFGLDITINDDVFEIVWDEDNDDYTYDMGSFAGAIEKSAGSFAYGGVSTKNVKLTAGSVTIKVKDNAASGTYTFTPTVQSKNMKKIVSGSNTSITAEATGCSVTINGSDPTPTTTVQVASDNGATYFLGADGGEYGSAFRITFDRPAAATSDDAIFGVTAGGTRKYSPKQTGVLFGLSGTVTLDVSFLNGSTEAGSYKKNGEAVAPKEVTAASVIMSDDAGNFFYTDEADAK